MEELDCQFEVVVDKDDFKFNCAHFVAFEGFRERLHGHNYNVVVRLVGSNIIGADGYLMDFGDVKSVTRSLCKELNEYFICPTLSDVLTFREEGANLIIECEDGSRFSFPRSDCAMLPIIHSTAEELAHYIWGRIIDVCTLETIRARGITMLEVRVGESPYQCATFKAKIPANEEVFTQLKDPKRIHPPRTVVRPCLSTTHSKAAATTSAGASSAANDTAESTTTDASANM